MTDSKSDWTFDHVHFNDDYTPKICYCGSEEFTQHTCATDAGFVSEFEVKCVRCKQRLAYWAYGSYDPCFAMEEL